jgi:DHA3 family tetracycline resistance protein-like MFS transporter
MIQVVGLEAIQLVLLGTLFEIVVFSCEIPTGIVADVVSRRKSVLFGLALFGVAFLVMGVFPFFAALIAGEAIRGIAETFISGAQEAWITDEIPHSEDAGRSASDVIVQGAQVGMFGRFAGVWIGAALGTVSLAFPLIIAGIGFVALAVFLMTQMQEHGFERNSEKGARRAALKGTLREGWSIVKTRGILLTIMVLTLIHGMSSEAFDRLWNKLILDLGNLPTVFGLSDVYWWAIINSLAMLFTVGLTALVRRKVDLDAPKALPKLLLALYSLVAVGMLLFGYSPYFWWAIGAFLFVRSLRGVISPLVVAWVNKHSTSDVRATMLSFEGQSHSFGEIMSGPMLGSVAKWISVQASMYASAGLLVPGILILRKRAKPDANDEPG